MYITQHIEQDKHKNALFFKMMHFKNVSFFKKAYQDKV